MGLTDYQEVWSAMRDFTASRGPTTDDELWLLEHPSVFTLGLNARREHLLDPGEIPVIPVDRGGQVTYHGPGQVVAYTLLDLRRRGWGVKALVGNLEQAVIDLLAGYRLEARRRPTAPGVYVDDAKVAAVGLRVRRDCSYHGVALNVDMDLSPYIRIDPCGYPGLRVTQLRDLGVKASKDEIADEFAGRLRLCLTQDDAERENVLIDRAGPE